MCAAVVLVFGFSKKGLSVGLEKDAMTCNCSSFIVFKAHVCLARTKLFLFSENSVQVFQPLSPHILPVITITHLCIIDFSVRHCHLADLMLETDLRSELCDASSFAEYPILSSST